MSRINDEIRKVNKSIFTNLKESCETKAVKEADGSIEPQDWNEQVFSMFVEYCDQSRENFTSVSDVKANFLEQIEAALETSPADDNLDEFLASMGR